MDDYSENNNNNNDLNNLENSNNTISNDSSNPINDMNNATPVDMSNISPTTIASNNSDESEEIIDFNPEEYSFSKDGTLQKNEGIKKYSKKALQIMQEEGLTEEEYKAKYENKKEDDRPASEDDVEYYVSNYDLEDYKEENKYNFDTEEHHKSVVERKKKEREAARLRSRA